MIIGIYNSIDEAKNNLNNKITPVWSRIIILGSDQTTYEWTWDTWKNINGIFIKWDVWDPWKPWKNWEDAKIDYELLVNMLYNKLVRDPLFIEKCKWKDGDPWKDWEDWEDYIPDINNVVTLLSQKLMNNESFIWLVKWKEGDPWKDGKTPVKGIDYIDWKDGKTPVKGIDYRDWDDWEDWFKVKIIEDDNNISLWDKELWIGLDKSLYIKHNNTILKL